MRPARASQPGCRAPLPPLSLGSPLRASRACATLPPPPPPLLSRALQAGIQIEYVWQGGLNALDLRCKTRTWTSSTPPTLETLPIWNFDGSSTGQAPGHDSEVLLKPVRIFPDPFRGLPHLLVLAECIDPKHKPIPTNTRAAANALFESKLGEVPWWGAWVVVPLRRGGGGGGGAVC